MQTRAQTRAQTRGQTRGQPVSAPDYGRLQISDGSPAPLGVHLEPDGANVAVHAPHAGTVSIRLLGGEQDTEVRLPARTDGVWHARISGLAPGQPYLLDVDGQRLLDPYARRVTGGLDGHESTMSAIVTSDVFDWQGDAAPRVPWDRTVIYETHVRGLTRLHPDVPEELRGTYAGLARPAVLDGLTDLGVTTIELLPVHHFVTEPAVAERGLVNYWGYNTAAHLAPHAPYAASGDPVTEFKEMVRAVHARGLEVVLDVVYNHTCEGGADGPLVHLRGLDDDGYYRHRDGAYVDVTGCGHTVRSDGPAAQDLVCESLRYWVTQMHVDGFRFDLASALARGADGDVELDDSLIARIGADPVLSEVKLIAEPWDASMDGYRLGRFPAEWSEWNDAFRDDVRDFWRGAGGGVRGIATRLAGSSQVFAHDGRGTRASVNFVTAHDGFTLRDVVSYDAKHNEANGEGNTDGHGDNRSWNCGAEGETDDPAIGALRGRQAANLLATTLLSAGTPMLCGGDELGRTQYGNNNAYCHDDELGWLPARAADGWEHLRPLVRQVLGLRAAHPVLRQPDFFTGDADPHTGREDLRWLHPNGRAWAEPDWDDHSAVSVGMILDGSGVGDVHAVLLLHAGGESLEWTLPGAPWAENYDVALDTADTGASRVRAGEPVRLGAHSMMLLLAAPRRT